MHIVADFPRPVREIEHCFIAMKDGCRLAARIWLPEDAEADPVPAILEYLPYRKRDGTAARDALTHPYFAGHGYAAVRVDMRGNGDSDGLMWDEYLKQEQDDALEVIDWLVAQPWCSGQVGMIGISWGGFNGLQVAARRPPALKAVVTVCSTDDRYADDIHYKGGCLLGENLGWATTMLSLSSRPPDPDLVGDDWRRLWFERLENMPLLVENWLQHQQRDDFWKHGSVCEDFSAIEAAVLAVGGWGDAYSNAVPRLLAGMQAPVRGLVGPWIHQYPHFAKPAPAIGFLQECLRWWDRWLKGRETGIMEEPLYRAYMMDATPPTGDYAYRAGRWIAEDAWPAPGIETLAYRLTADRTLGADGAEAALAIRSPQDCGRASGEFCAMSDGGSEWPGEQRYDDADSLCFDSAPLTERLEIFGAPAVELEVAADRPQALLAVRLCDLDPEGRSSRVTYGVLNLAQREGPEAPAPLEPGRRYAVRVQLDDIAYAVPAGHRLRLAVSTSYWPLVWPSPEAAEVTLTAGTSRLLLPRRPARTETAPRFEDPEGAPPLTQEELRPPRSWRRVTKDLASGKSVLEIFDDSGAHRTLSHGLETGSSYSERYSIHPDDPLSAEAYCAWTQTLGRGAWQVRTEADSKQWADRENFYLEAGLRAYEGGTEVFARQWSRRVPRRNL
ncbi:MAG TPA: CocE/NonD family hydrolase [Kiloniellaceae bacterium]|nr:CocE/NonD family hydrolase [Kiloniellaceae bacterium]